MVLISLLVKNQNFLLGLRYLKDIRIVGESVVSRREWPSGLMSCKWGGRFPVQTGLSAWPGSARLNLVMILLATFRSKIDKKAVINIGWLRLSLLKIKSYELCQKFDLVKNPSKNLRCILQRNSSILIYV